MISSSQAECSQNDGVAPCTQYGHRTCILFTLPHPAQVFKAVTSFNALPAICRLLVLEYDVFFLGTARNRESQMSRKSEGSVRIGDTAGTRIGGRYMRRRTGVVSALRSHGEVRGLRSSMSGFAAGLRAMSAVLTPCSPAKLAIDLNVAAIDFHDVRTGAQLAPSLFGRSVICPLSRHERKGSPGKLHLSSIPKIPTERTRFSLSPFFDSF